MIRFLLLCAVQIFYLTCNNKLYGQQKMIPLAIDKLNRDSLYEIIRDKESVKDYQPLSEIYRGIYIYYFQTKFTDSAITYALKAEEYSFKAGDSANYYYDLVQLGELSVHAHNYETAKIYYQKARDYYLRTNNFKMLFHAYGGLSGIYANQKDTINFLKYNSLAIYASKKGKDTLAQVIVNDEYIQILISQHKTDESIRELHKNLFLINNASVFGNSEQVRIFWNGLQLNLLGMCYYGKKEYHTAIKYLKEAQLNDKKTAAFSAQNFVRSRLVVNSYINLNEYDSALKYVDIFFAQAKEVLENIDPGKLNEISTKYETEKKQRQIAELQRNSQVQQLTVSNQRKLNIAIVSIFFLLCVSGYLILKNISQKRKMALEEAKKEIFQEQQLHRQKELEMRNRISRDLHDDIGATLSSVKAYSEILKEDPTNSVIAELIKDNSTEMLERLEVIAWATNPQHDHFKSLNNRMIKFAAPLCHAKNIKFQINSNGINEDMLMPGEVRQNIFLIFKEKLNNMIKYADATKCDAQFSITGNRFILQITDNGKGFDGTTKGVGNGWINMTKRTEDLDGKLKIASAIEKGTQITMELYYPFKIPNSWDKKQV